MSVALDKQTKRKLARFYNNHADFIDLMLDAAGKSWGDLTQDQQKQLYKEHTGEAL